MINLVRGFRGKLEDHINLELPFQVTMKTSGNAVYDVCCFGVDAENKLSDDRYMVFFNQTASPAQEIQMNQDTFTVNLSKLPDKIVKLVFTVSIDGNGTMKQIHAHNVSISQNGNTVMELNMTGDSFSSERAIISIELYLKSVWRINVVANGFDGGLEELLKQYGGELAEESAAEPEKPLDEAKKTVPPVSSAPSKGKVTVKYDDQSFETEITVNGQPFDTSRIAGKEITDWAYPFMFRRIKWNGFYDEMVAALGGAKEFDLVFEGSDAALAELRESWENAPVNVVSGRSNTVSIFYDADSLKTEITVNGQPFDVSRISGMDIEDWAHPFMMRKVKWDGIFDELKAALGTEEYEIQFSGTRTAMKMLMEECPETVTISFKKNDKPAKSTNEVTVKSVHSSDNTANPIEYGSERFQEMWRNEEYDTLLPIVRDAAENGNMEAQGDLGVMFQLGYGVDVNMPEALKWYLKAAQQGDIACMESVAKIYSGGYAGCESLINSGKAVEWYEKAEKAATVEDLFDYYGYYEFLMHEGRERDAIAVLRRGANKGDMFAMRDLATAYYFGDGTSQDFETAGEWFEKAADAGEAVSMMRMGEFCLYAKGNVPEDNDRAFQYLQNAVEKDDELPYAHLLLGKCYYNGWGTSENLRKAKEHFKTAAEGDSTEAMYWLGLVYRDEGNGKEATKWFQKAADNDFCDGFLALGYMYLYGNAVKQNYQRAYDFFKKAMGQGSAEAQYAIGNMYYEGQHVRQNYDEAVRRFRKAADKGITDAKAMLGLCYLCGTGISQNDEYGSDLLEEAAEEGSELAAELIDGYNEAYDEAYNNASNRQPGGKVDKIINTANDFIKSDKGQAVLKKAGKGAAMGAVSGLAGGTPLSVVGGALKGAAGAAITAFAADDDDDE